VRCEICAPRTIHLLTVKETAEYLRIPIPTVYYLVQRGKIPAIQIGGRWRVKKSSLDRDILHQDKQGQPTVLVVDDDPGLQNLFHSHPIGILVKAQKKWLEWFFNSVTRQR